MGQILSEYIQLAMRRATYEIDEDGWYDGKISEFEELLVSATNLEDCRNELLAALEQFIVAALRLQYPLPIINSIDLNQVVPPNMSVGAMIWLASNDTASTHEH